MGNSHSGWYRKAGKVSDVSGGLQGLGGSWSGTASHSVADRWSDTFTGRFTQAATWYIVGGAASGLMGLLPVAFGGG